MKLLSYLKSRKLDKINAATAAEIERIEDLDTLEELLAAADTSADKKAKLEALKSRLFALMFEELGGEGEDKDPVEKFYAALQAMGLKKIKQLSEPEVLAIDKQFPSSLYKVGRERFGEEFDKLSGALIGRGMSFIIARIDQANLRKVMAAEEAPNANVFKLSWKGKIKFEEFLSPEHGGNGNTYTLDVIPHSHVAFFDSDLQVHSLNRTSPAVATYRYTKRSGRPTW